jgi:hypothetical protein
MENCATPTGPLEIPRKGEVNSQKIRERLGNGTDSNGKWECYSIFHNTHSHCFALVTFT